MSINALARLLGIDAAPMPALEPQEQWYLQGFLTGLQSDEARQMGGVPTLPATAPLTPAKRAMVDGLLAGIFSRTWLPAGESQPALAMVDMAGATTLSNQTAVTMVWASQTGTAEGFATQCAERLKREGCVVSLSRMDAIDLPQLKSARQILLVTSTFGDGDPPDCGASFWQALQRDDAAAAVSGARYSVLAFGDSSYDQFCGFGRRLDERLAQLGAQRLLARVDCEPDYQAPALAWLDAVSQALAPAKTAAQPVVALAEVGHGNTHESTGALPTSTPTAPAFSKHKPLRTRMLLNRLLNSEGASKETRQIVFDLADTGLAYEAGDALGVWPTNCPELVGDMLSALKLAPATTVSVKDLGDMSLSQALLQHHEIARITPDVLDFVAERAGNPELSRLLKPDNQAQLKAWLWNKQTVDLLHTFPITASAAEWLAVLKRLQPRLYSISSSPKAHTNEVHLTMSTVRYFNGEKPRGGVCSTFLADRSNEADIPLFVQKSAHFRPPAQSTAPMIMVGPGTGVAPFRAFLHERRARGDLGRNWLFFGEQHAATDFYYRDELEGMHKDGLLTQLSLAFSRDQAEKVYVQDRMRAQGAELWSWLQDGAHFCVCGDASRMAKDVDQALREVVQLHGGLSEDAAKTYVRQMSTDKRYVRDVY